MKAQKIYTDKAGNTLWKRWIKTRKIWQLSAKNAKGQVVVASGVNTLLKKSKMGKITNIKGKKIVKKAKYIRR